MKKLLSFFICFSMIITASAQLGGILDRAKQRTKAKVEQKIDQKIDKTVDKQVDKADDAVSGKSQPNQKKSSQAGSEAQPDDAGGNAAVKSSNTFKSYSKFDFVPGEKVVAAEDFGQDALGDFPARWNTNGSGEVVTTSLAEGKFLMTQKEVVFYPEWVNNLPDNFTLEFDLLCSDKFSFYSGHFIAGFTSAVNVGKDFRVFGKFGDGRIENGGGFEVTFHPTNAGGSQGASVFASSHNKKEYLRNEINQDQFSDKGNHKAHISVWRQKTRIRVYINDKKVWDLPRALPEGLKLNSLYFRNDGNNSNEDALYMGNIRLAVGAPDTRNKLITEGKFVTHGILFDVNSDRIKPESYGAIKDIANVFNENGTVHVKIIGHTDSDGDDKTNLALSKKRAESVKSTLIKDFGIDASRLSTDGKGESVPMDKNASPEGKANNRRVEFVKE